MKVTVVGTGYVGLVSGVCFAEFGHDVTCIDVNEKIVEMLKNGRPHIYEPGLGDMITRNIKANRINFCTDYSSVKNSKVIFLAVGTPSGDDGSADLTYLHAATASVAREMAPETILVIKSTVPIGAHKEIEKIVGQNSKNKFYLVNNPEFLKEGSAIDDFMKPDRVVIGRKEEYAGKIMEELYAPLMLQGNPIYMMSNLSAEMTKYASNCFLATKISFINDIAKLCDISGADIEEVRKGMTSDKRIGPHFLYPGPGYGGSCFPKDVKALMYTAKNNFDYDLRLIKAVELVNNDQKVYMFHKIKKHFNGDLKDKKFGFWGVSFKPKTDDVRESPAIEMAAALIAEGATVNFFDPEGGDNFLKLMESNSKTKNRTFQCHNKYDCLNDVDGMVLITEWSEFRAPDYHEIKKRLRTPVIFDARNILKTEKVLEMGITYYAIGKRVL